MSKSASYTSFETSKILTKKLSIFYQNLSFLEDQNLAKKQNCKKAKRNDLMLTKYANKKQVKIAHIHMFLVTQAHSYQQTPFLLL